MITHKDEDFFSELCGHIGNVIMSYYKGLYSTSYKEDRSPLTEADLASHRLIVTALLNRWPHIPILSEEGSSETTEDRFSWEYFWLVDPLDGTKEFVHGADEFTVNIALIHKSRPIFGVVYVPVSRTMYVGYVGTGAYRIQNGMRKELHFSRTEKKGRTKVAVSRFHLDPKTKAFLDFFKDICEPVVRGSALKFCSVAEGNVDLYLRFGPTWEWDTAAGQAVVEAAGGNVIAMPAQISLTYNKPNLKNGPFVVIPDTNEFMKSPFKEWLLLQDFKK